MIETVIFKGVKRKFGKDFKMCFFQGNSKIEAFKVVYGFGETEL